MARLAKYSVNHYRKIFRLNELNQVCNLKGRRVSVRVDNKGYFVTRGYLLHRIIFGLHHGWLPHEIDHIDRNPQNNSIENLRASSPILNATNRGLSVNSTTGYLGVVRQGNGYQAQSCGFGYIAYDAHPEIAAIHYDVIVSQIFGEHATTNYSLGLYQEAGLREVARNFINIIPHDNGTPLVRKILAHREKNLNSIRMMVDG